MIRVLYSFLFVIAVFCTMVTLYAQPKQAETYRPIEIALTSPKTYPHPHKDVLVTCTFMHTSGKSIRIYGFWNGNVNSTSSAGSTTADYRVRFAPVLEGEWTYRTTCSDTTNAGLHGITGTIAARAYTGTNHLYAKGFPKVASNGRYLTYADGDPFFYLGDTAWEITWRSTLDEVKKLMANRKERGFTALHFEPMTEALFPEGVTNRQGLTYFLNRDFSMINPRYFDYVDSIVQIANDNGLVAVIVPVWASGRTEANYNSNWFPYYFLSNEQCLLMARYIAARYAGYNVIWIVGADAPYDTPARKSFWSQFAETLHTADGRQHLATCHPAGYTGSYDYFDGTTKWLDFNMYQAAHLINVPSNWVFAERAYNLMPSKPVINGEALYEDINPNFWSANRDPSLHAQAIDVRWASYQSILSGTMVGITYGADGIWQWNSATMPSDALSPRFNVDSAMNFPGAVQMGILKRIMQRYKWYELVPRQDLLRSNHSDDQRVAVAQSRETLMAYLPKGVGSVSVTTGELGSNIMYRWHNPATGDSTALAPATQPLVANSPNANQDWVLVVSNKFTSAVQQPPPLVSALIVFPSPSSDGFVNVSYQAPPDRTVELSVYSLIGERLLTVKESDVVGTFTSRLDMRMYGTGTYLYQVRAGGAELKTGLFQIIR